jgi:hypothetical protein
MNDAILLEYQRREDEAHHASIRKGAEAYDLERELELATDPAEIAQLSARYEQTHGEWIQLIGKYLEANVETAKMAKVVLAAQLGTSQPEEFRHVVGPMWDKYIWEAEEELRRHHDRYSVVDLNQ